MGCGCNGAKVGVGGTGEGYKGGGGGKPTEAAAWVPPVQAAPAVAAVDQRVTDAILAYVPKPAESHSAWWKAPAPAAPVGFDGPLQDAHNAGLKAGAKGSAGTESAATFLPSNPVARAALFAVANVAEALDNHESAKWWTATQGKPTEQASAGSPWWKAPAPAAAAVNVATQNVKPSNTASTGGLGGMWQRIAASMAGSNAAGGLGEKPDVKWPFLQQDSKIKLAEVTFPAQIRDAILAAHGNGALLTPDEWARLASQIGGTHAISIALEAAYSNLTQSNGLLGDTYKAGTAARAASDWLDGLPFFFWKAPTQQGGSSANLWTLKGKVEAYWRANGRLYLWNAP